MKKMNKAVLEATEKCSKSELLNLLFKQEIIHFVKVVVSLDEDGDKIVTCKMFTSWENAIKEIEKYKNTHHISVWLCVNNADVNILDVEVANHITQDKTEDKLNWIKEKADAMCDLMNETLLQRYENEYDWLDYQDGEVNTYDTLNKVYKFLLTIREDLDTDTFDL